MIIVAIVLVCVGLFILFCKTLEDDVGKVVEYQRQTHERISVVHDRVSTIEQHEYAQDARLDHQQKQLKGLREDVSEMGKDIGWKDDNRKTQVMKQKNSENDSDS